MDRAVDGPGRVPEAYQPPGEGEGWPVLVDGLTFSKGRGLRHLSRPRSSTPAPWRA